MKSVAVVEHGVLRVRFLDSTEGTVDMRGFLRSDASIGTVFEPLRDMHVFSQAAVHMGVVEWPGEVDLAPDAMYDEIRAHGVWVLN